MCVCGAAQATLEQAEVDEAEMKPAKVDEATGCMGRQEGEGEGIDQAFSAFLDTRSVSFSSSRYALLQFAPQNLPILSRCHERTRNANTYFWQFLCVCVCGAAQAPLEQAKVDEAEMKPAKVDEATGCIGRQEGEGEGIDQAFSALLDTRSVSFSSSCYALPQFAYQNLPQ